ncbi:MAG: hypothetical protein LKJ17_07140 [Oscillospiraceae bacterium]|jgi:hypothetical protein|nr:hypothetical protein [Oscillospiraceae bacterium]
MEILAKVSSIDGGKYRVSAGGSVSSPISRLSNAVRLETDEDGKLKKILPQVGNIVLCWFPGNALTDGIIIGIEEE